MKLWKASMPLMSDGRWIFRNSASNMLGSLSLTGQWRAVNILRVLRLRSATLRTSGKGPLMLSVGAQRQSRSTSLFLNFLPLPLLGEAQGKDYQSNNRG